MSKYNYDCKRDDYLTPPELILKVLADNGLQQFDCDVCCSQDNIPAAFRYRKDGLYLSSGNCVSLKNGLTGPWFPINWCNPPFKIAREFVKKAIEEQKKGNTTFMLLPVRTETDYWYTLIMQEGKPVRESIEITFLKKGLCFLEPNTGKPVQMKKTKADGSIEYVDGVYKDGLALVIFRGIKDEKK